MLKKIKFISFSEYDDYLAASRDDPKIEILLEVSNIYRTIVALFVSLSLLALYEIIQSKWPIVLDYYAYVLIPALLLIFLIAYKKQVGYIAKRISSSKNK